MKRNVITGSLLVVAGIGIGLAAAHLPVASATPAPAAHALAQQTFRVSIDEVRRNLVFAQPFTGHYRTTVTLSDGSRRHIELTPMLHDGMQVVRLKDNGRMTYMGLDSTATNDHLMVQVSDVAVVRRRLEAEGFPADQLDLHR